jgi:methyl-accepting chemotaxis protein
MLGQYFSRQQGKYIVAPIKKLTDASSRIARGDYQHPVAIESADETGILAENFERMRQQVKEYTENLEHKVKERTTALEVAQKSALAMPIKPVWQRLPLVYSTMSAISLIARTPLLLQLGIL